MFLNVIQGPAPLYRHKTEKLVSADETGLIERGQLLYVDAQDEWRIAGTAQAGGATAPGPILWMAEQAGDDLTAGMAGGLPDGGGQAKIGAVCITPSMTVETDMFDGELALEGLLSVGADGKFVAHTTGDTVYGRCVAVSASRWANNAVAVPGYRTGANVDVIRVVTLYIPNIATA